MAWAAEIDPMSGTSRRGCLVEMGSAPSSSQATRISCGGCCCAQADNALGLSTRCAMSTAFSAKRPAHCIVQDTFSLGTRKGVGRVH